MGINKWKLLNTYRKNKDDIKSIIFKTYPDFVFKSIDQLPAGEIPIFTFHSVETDKFEYLINYLVENNYHTITTDQYYEFLSGNLKVDKNTVMLTFDDGLGSLWSVAYPVLKKYGLHATSFLLPAVIKDDFNYLPNLDDYWAGKSNIDKIDKREKIEPFCSWKEIKIMQESGVFDFQSHSFDHHSIFKSEKLVDFMNPNMDDSFLTGSFNPIINVGNYGTVPVKLDLGYPIYKWGANLGETRRFIEDYSLASKCVEYVSINGGKVFFENDKWKENLKDYYNELISKNGNAGKFQTDEERFDDLLRDLSTSKKMIEKEIGSEVKHLCYPWGFGSDLAVEASKESGYISNYWCQLNRKLIMKVGEDPFYIPRILYEDYILSLPGKNRLPLSQQLKNKFNKFVLKNN